jgi:hypothetical protein
VEPPSDPSPAPAHAGFRLARVLSERRDREGSYAALAEAIEKSNPARPAAGPKPSPIPSPKPDQGRDEGKQRKSKRGVDRRKLKALVEGDPNVVLSVRELRAIDVYLDRYGQGLAYVPLFERPDLLQTLADSGRVTFLLASKPEEGLRYFSHWDVLAMAEIQRGINPSEMSVRFDIQDVLLQETQQKAAGSSKMGGWSELLGDQGPSLVCLGSTRTGPAAEAMLCRMFEVPEFEDPPPADKQRIPFHFVWKPMLPYVFSSHFHLGSVDLFSRDLDAANTVRERRASAIVTAEDVFVDRVYPERIGDTYGVCVVQRRKRGQVWLVLAGITGVATFVAAKLAKSLTTRLHEQEAGQNSDVYWAVIRARLPDVPDDPDRPLASVRTFAEEAIVSGLHAWRPE